jgi:hypothetical protein
MFIITLGTIAVQFYEQHANANPSYVWLADIVFVFATLVELILKVHVAGSTQAMCNTIT